MTAGSRAAAAALLVGLVACAAPPAPLAADELAALRTAAGRDAWGAVAALELEGTARVLGRDEPFRLLLAPDGRYRREVAGPLGRVEVFDGERAWRRDHSEVGRELALGARDRAPLLASLRSGAWLDDPGLVRGTLGPDRVTLTRPGTPLDLELLLEPGTRLPHQAIERGDERATVATFADWAAVDGVPVPFRVIVGGGGVEAQAWTVTRATTLAALPPGAFEPPPAAPGDVTFDPAAGPDVEVWRARTGHLFVRPELDDASAGWWLLDTGAGAMVVDRRLARDRGLAPLGTVQAVGVGGREPAALVGADAFALGPLSWQGLVLVELDLAPVADLLGVPVAGIVGYELFSRAVCDLEPGPVPVSPGDLDEDGLPDPAPALVGGGRLGLLDPDGWEPPAGVAFAPLAFDGHTANVEARFPTPAGPVTAWFRLDTGANGSVTFHAPAVRAHRLLAQRDTRPARFGGVAGDGAGFLAVLEWFELGGRRFVELECSLATAVEGTFADPYTAGNLGQELLEPFRLWIDYPGQRLGFAPRRAD